MRHAPAIGASVILAACAPAPAASPPAPHDHHHGDHHFEHAEQWVAAFEGPARDAWQHPAEVIAALGLSPGMTVADIGAGTGYFLPSLSRAVGPGGHVLGLDIETDMVRYMKERAQREGLANVEPRVVAPGDPQLPAGAVDRVLIVDTWHHIEDRAAYAARLRAALRPGGAVYIVDFKLDATHGPPPDHRLSPEQVMAELRQGGLSPALVPASLPEQYIVAGTAG